MLAIGSITEYKETTDVGRFKENDIGEWRVFNWPRRSRSSKEALTTSSTGFSQGKGNRQMK